MTLPTGGVIWNITQQARRYVPDLRGSAWAGRRRPGREGTRHCMSWALASLVMKNPGAWEAPGVKTARSARNDAPAGLEPPLQTSLEEGR